MIQIPDDQLCIVIPLTPWTERRKLIGMSKSLIIDNYLTGIRMTAPWKSICTSGGSGVRGCLKSNSQEVMPQLEVERRPVA